jgi:hypothetical protein
MGKLLIVQSVLISFHYYHEAFNAIVIVSITYWFITNVYQLICQKNYVLMKYRLRQIVLFIVLTTFITNCRQEEITKSSGQLQFSFSQKPLTNSGGRSTSTAQPSFALLSIKDSNGTLLESAKKIELYNFGGNFVTESVQLPVGNYSLTQFMILDENQNVLYATPTAGSSWLSMLPIRFLSISQSVKMAPLLLHHRFFRSLLKHRLKVLAMQVSGLKWLHHQSLKKSS